MIFGKFVTVIRAFFNSIANALWERDPIAIMQLQKAEADLVQNQEQLKMHEDAYEINLKKIQYANKQLAEVREKIERYNADLKMTAAEAEIARIAGDLNFDVTTDFGQIEQIIQQKIDTNRGKVRVA